MKIYSLLISFEDVSPVEKMVIVDDPAREVRLKIEDMFLLFGKSPTKDGGHSSLLVAQVRTLP